MAALPDDVWHLVCKKLHLTDLFRFCSSHRHAEISIGNAQAQWDSLFMDFRWVDDVRLRGQTPVLMFVDGERPYVYLYLASRNNEPFDKDPDSQTERDVALLKKIKESLRSNNRSRSPFEVQLETCTLDMSNVLFHGVYICQHLFQMPSKNNVVMAIYGERLENVKPKVFHNKMAFIELKGFKPSMFANETIREYPWSIVTGVYRTIA
jgi:hypothetical protein